MGKVGSNARTAMTTAKTTLLGHDEVDEALVYPNRVLGGVLAIELSGCIIEVFCRDGRCVRERELLLLCRSPAFKVF